MTDDNVTELSDHTNDSRQISPERLLRAAMHEVQDNPGKWNKCLVIFVRDDIPDAYNYAFRNSGLNATSMITAATLVRDDASEVIRHGELFEVED